MSNIKTDEIQISVLKEHPYYFFYINEGKMNIDAMFKKKVYIAFYHDL